MRRILLHTGLRTRTALAVQSIAEFRDLINAIARDNSSRNLIVQLTDDRNNCLTVGFGPVLGLVSFEPESAVAMYNALGDVIIRTYDKAVFQFGGYRVEAGPDNLLTRELAFAIAEQWLVDGTFDESVPWREYRPSRPFGPGAPKRRPEPSHGRSSTPMNFADLLRAISLTIGCHLKPPCGLPQVSPTHMLPSDVVEFYQRCGGGELFFKSPYRIRIAAPEDFVPANAVLLETSTSADDISDSWYIIGAGVDGPRNSPISIDCSIPRLGRCYDSSWDRHGVAGSCPIIARSFTDLLESLWRGRGEHLYWLSSRFARIGDAYDGYRYQHD